MTTFKLVNPPIEFGMDIRGWTVGTYRDESTYTIHCGGIEKVLGIEGSPIAKSKSELILTLCLLFLQDKTHFQEVWW